MKLSTLIEVLVVSVLIAFVSSKSVEPRGRWPNKHLIRISVKLCSIITIFISFFL